MKTLIHDATVVQDFEQNEINKNFSILINEEGVIEELGKASEFESRKQEFNIFPMNEKIVMPGFINCHTHLTATLGRGILEDLAFPPILPYPRSANSYLSEEETQIMATLGVLEGIRSGTTTFVELGRDVEKYASAISETGARFFLGEMMTDLTYNVIKAGSPLKSKNDFSEDLADQAYTRAINLFESWNNKERDRIKVVFSPATADSCSPSMLQKSRELAEEKQTVYTIHLSQSHQEVDGIKNAWNLKPTEYLNAYDFLGPDLIAAHCRYVDESEIALLGKFSVGISNNPAIAARRGAAAPVTELIQSGCSIGIGTDNMAEDMLEAARTGYFAERVRRNNETTPTANNVLGWATTGGAEITNSTHNLGSLHVGKQADLIAVNFNKAHLAPNLRVVSNFINNGISSDIESVMVQGKFIMHDKKILNVDEEKIISEAQIIAQKSWTKLRESYPNLNMLVELDNI